MPEFVYQEPFPLGKDETTYRKLDGSEQYIKTANFDGREVLKVDPEGLTFLANQAFRDVSFLLRPEHNEQVAKILQDSDASMNDKGVAIAFLRNAEVSAQFELPSCQDTGTATIVAKGGGSGNKTMLFQETKALLNPEKLEAFLVDKMKTLGTAACPPYHLAFVIGGTSAEANLKTVKMASTKYYDTLPTSGNEHGRAFRDVELEKKLQERAEKLGIGAQFGGKYFTHDVRVIRLPRHGASCPVGMGVSCSADRNVKAKITRDGMYLEELDRNPGRLIPEQYRRKHEHGVKVDLNQPMETVLAELTKHPVATPLLLNGTLIVGRDIAHAKWKERIDKGEGIPEYLKKHPVYYAGPAKTPAGKPSGSFGPTTAGRMDSYVDLLQSHGGSMVMIAKGNRSQQVTDACKKHGGFYLGSIGGPAALLAEENIKKVECIDYPELGMEAVWQIDVENFPAFILVDDKGNDFFKQLGC